MSSFMAFECSFRAHSSKKSSRALGLASIQPVFCADYDNNTKLRVIYLSSTERKEVSGGQESILLKETDIHILVSRWGQPKACLLG